MKGKTTLADALLAYNGIISTRMSGKVKLVYFFLKK
jgi:translation elongation factor EF-G